MKESTARKWHRNLGIVLALFILVQVGTGMLLTFNHMTEGHSHEHETSVVTDKPGHNHDDHGSIDQRQVSAPAGSSVTETGFGERILTLFHHGGGTLGAYYRLVLSVGIFVQVAMGVLIFLQMRGRSRKAGPKH